MTDAEFIVKTREGLGLSQTELAERLGVTPSAVSRWEAGARALPGPARKLLEQMSGSPEPARPVPALKPGKLGLAVVLALIGGSAGAYFAFGSTDGQQPPAPTRQVTSLPIQTVDIRADDRVLGSTAAPVTMVEYASMTCPHCAHFQRDVVPSVIRNYIDTGKVRFVFREFPLDAAARLASALARCLSGDAYFSFIDLLFANQAIWLKDSNGDGRITLEKDVIPGLNQIGAMAGMGKDRVENCTGDKANLAAVDANWQEANSRYGIDSTPTLIIQGEVHKGEMSYEALKAILDSSLAKK